MATIAQTLWVRVNGWFLSLYPFLDGRTAAERGLSHKQWRALGKTVRQIHSQRLPAGLQQALPQETFVPSRRYLLAEVEALSSDREVADGEVADPVTRELIAFWRSSYERIRSLIARADALGEALRHEPLPLALGHADLHCWNVLCDDADTLWLVDWDETVFAPKERERMCFVGGIGHGLIEPSKTCLFLEGYGNTRIDRRALAYCRYAWAVQDMAAYAEEVFSSPTLSARDREAAVRGFIDLFAPGNIVEIAFAANTGLE